MNRRTLSLLTLVACVLCGASATAATPLPVSGLVVDLPPGVEVTTTSEEGPGDDPVVVDALRGDGFEATVALESLAACGAHLSRLGATRVVRIDGDEPIIVGTTEEGLRGTGRSWRCHGITVDGAADPWWLRATSQATPGDRAAKARAKAATEAVVSAYHAMGPARAKARAARAGEGVFVGDDLPSVRPRSGSRFLKSAGRLELASLGATLTLPAPGEGVWRGASLTYAMRSGAVGAGEVVDRWAKRGDDWIRAESSVLLWPVNATCEPPKPGEKLTRTFAAKAAPWQLRVKAHGEDRVVRTCTVFGGDTLTWTHTARGDADAAALDAFVARFGATLTDLSDQLAHLGALPPRPYDDVVKSALPTALDFGGLTVARPDDGIAWKRTEGGVRALVPALAQLEVHVIAKPRSVWASCARVAEMLAGDAKFIDAPAAAHVPEGWVDLPYEARLTSTTRRVVCHATKGQVLAVLVDATTPTRDLAPLQPLLAAIAHPDGPAAAGKPVK